MARPRTFEPDEVVAAAMICFREHGYQATSIRDLETATGLKAASLYKAFGNKASLFETALAHYRLEVVQRRIGTHLRHENGLAGIASLFSSTYLTEASPWHGCMIANSSLESEALDAAANAQLRLGLSEIRDALKAQLDHCVAIGEVDSSLDTAVGAEMLLVLYQGQLGLMRLGGTGIGIDFDSLVASALDQLRSQTNTQQGDTT